MIAFVCSTIKCFAIIESNCINNGLDSVGELCKLISFFTTNLNVHLFKDHGEGIVMIIEK